MIDYEGFALTYIFCALESKRNCTGSDLLLYIYHCLPVSRKCINHSRFALTICKL